MSILRCETNGIEFFTVQATGESGISHRGLAILCGVTHWTINELVKNLEAKQAAKRLKAFIGKDLHLEGVYKKKGGVVKILRADFCAATVKHYALEGREIAEQSMDKFMTLGINTWIQSITGWQTQETPPITTEEFNPDTIQLQSDIDSEYLLQQIELLQHDLMVALKHRHAIHNIVEKPTVVDLSLNQIVHTAVHVQAQKLNQALATLQSIQDKIEVLTTIRQQIDKYNNLWQSFARITHLVAELRQENTNLKQVIEQQKILFAPRRKAQAQLLTNKNLETVLEPRIKEIIAILMKSQIRTGGHRAIAICTRKATIYAMYEIGQSLNEIAISLQMPYETVKTYVKLTRADIRNYYSAQN
ncbi:conserved hypothetical protein [Hyella patelloides LEGE 07179]|uniref:Uncharacterized protein n=1 Tax=Hyella patelloides LEGE 07179 TaxID=945734 RepID=A0A563W3E7_9CYAN|nr:sigma-70 family RNA polymerase sigma factor [Hyella patelloides]VEP18147.1 conserved hypothetical protein [Hyella patelloides LEGE 07179]